MARRITQTTEGIKLRDKVWFWMIIRKEHRLIQGKVTYIAKRDEEMTIEFEMPEDADRWTKHYGNKIKRYIAHRTKEEAVNYKLDNIKRKLKKIENDRIKLDSEEEQLRKLHSEIYWTFPNRRR